MQLNDSGEIRFPKCGSRSIGKNKKEKSQKLLILR
jgi:hypothetical protein